MFTTRTKVYFFVAAILGGIFAMTGIDISLPGLGIWGLLAIALILGIAADIKRRQAS